MNKLILYIFYEIFTGITILVCQDFKKNSDDFNMSDYARMHSKKIWKYTQLIFLVLFILNTITLFKLLS